MRKRIGSGLAAIALSGAMLIGAAAPTSAAKVEICVEYPDGIVICCDGNIVLITTKSMM